MATRGLVRLVNTSGRGVLCLAGNVDAAAVADFHARYGREPVPVDAVDTGSVTRLSEAALDLVLDHVRAGELRGRVVPVLRSPAVARVVARSTQAG